MHGAHGQAREAGEQRREEPRRQEASRGAEAMAAHDAEGGGGAAAARAAAHAHAHAHGPMCRDVLRRGGGEQAREEERAGTRLVALEELHLDAELEAADERHNLRHLLLWVLVVVAQRGDDIGECDDAAHHLCGWDAVVSTKAH